MLTALLLTSLSLAPAAAALAAQQEPPVKVWLSKKGDLLQGDRVRVHARTESDGYLVIIHAEPDGRLRVLFPLDPYNDNFVRGQRDLEIRGRGDREAFRVFVNGGLGTVYAAFSRDPFQFGEFVRDDHWDYRLLETWHITEGLDAETELTALVQHMTPNTSFHYDMAQYFVGEQVASGGGGGVVVSPYVGFGWGGGWGWGVGIGWGWGSFGIGWGGVEAGAGDTHTTVGVTPTTATGAAAMGTGTRTTMRTTPTTDMATATDTAPVTVTDTVGTGTTVTTSSGTSVGG